MIKLTLFLGRRRRKCISAREVIVLLETGASFRPGTRLNRQSAPAADWAEQN